MKKLLSFLFILALGIGFVACGQDAQNEEQSLDLLDDTQVFTVEALSAASLLDYDSVSALSFVELSDTEEPDELVDDEIDEIDKYLEMMQTYLGDNEGLTVNVLDSDKPEYENLVSFTTVDAYGNQVEYLLYYNETVYVETDDDELTTEGSTNANPEGQFRFVDEDDDLVEHSLSGLIIFGEIEYEVEGKKMVNEEGASTIILRAFVDSDNCVKVSYKIDEEDGNTKFFFQVKEEGIIVSKTRVHVVETEEGGLNVHLDFQDEFVSSKYIFRQIESEGTSLIHIKYSITNLEDGSKETGNIHIEVTVDPETGELIYSYKVLGSQNGNTERVIEKRRSLQRAANGRNQA